MSVACFMRRLAWSTAPSFLCFSCSLLLLNFFSLSVLTFLLDAIVLLLKFFVLTFVLFSFQGGDSGAFCGGSSGKSKFLNLFYFFLIDDVKEKRLTKIREEKLDFFNKMLNVVLISRAHAVALLLEGI